MDGLLPADDFGAIESTLVILETPFGTPPQALHAEGSAKYFGIGINTQFHVIGTKVIRGVQRVTEKGSDVACTHPVHCFFLYVVDC